MPETAEKPLPKIKKTGSREQTRRNHLSKLIAAARQLFIEVGYEAATVRKIAEVSGIGMGTIFYYVREKRDFVYLIFNDQAEERLERAFAALHPWQSFRVKLLSLAESHYQALGLEPELGRLFLSQVDHTPPGPHYLRNLEIRKREQVLMQALVAEAQASGELRSNASADSIARAIFFAGTSAASVWINSPDPQWRTGLQDFAEILDVILFGHLVTDKGPA